MAKGAYIGVDGKARKTKKGYVGVGGVARKIKKGYIGVGGVARQNFSGFDPVFANNTWVQIIEACKGGSVPDTWVVGDQKAMTINGVDYLINIIGKNHDTYSDGSGTAPLTFQMHDLYGTKYKMNDTNTATGAWGASVIRNTNLPEILALMPSEVQSGIKNVNKLSAETTTSVLTTSDNLFLLSEIEIFGERVYSKPGEGEQYEYYADGNSKIKSLNGSVTQWWTRSTYASGKWLRIDASGASTNVSATYLSGLAIAFCF